MMFGVRSRSSGRVGIIVVTVVAALAITVGCNLVVGSYDYRDPTQDPGFVPDRDARVDDSGEVEEGDCSVDLAVECYACTPQTNEQHLNACGESPCIPFDRTRLNTLLLPDGGLPPLPDSGS